MMHGTANEVNSHVWTLLEIRKLLKELFSYLILRCILCFLIGCRSHLGLDRIMDSESSVKMQVGNRHKELHRFQRQMLVRN